MSKGLEKVEGFGTPSNINEVLDYCKGCSTPADATIAVMMTWNLMVEYHQKIMAQAALHELTNEVLEVTDK